MNDCIDVEDFVNEGNSFFANVNLYHEKAYAILSLIVDFFSKKKRTYEKEFLAVSIVKNRVRETSYDIGEDIKDKLELWYHSSNKEELDESIYKLDFDNKVFLFKLFEFSKGNAILAGYALKDSVSVRSFLASFNEKKMKEKYERILDIL